MDNESDQSLSDVLKTGGLGIALVFVVASVCIFPFEHHYFTDYVATAFMATTPAQIIVGLMWHNSVPGLIENQSQPVKGLLLASLVVCVGAIVMAFLMHVASGGHGPTPMLIQYAILSIVCILWLVPVWECWPVSLLSKSPLVVGLLAIILVYFLAYFLQKIFFDYSFLGAVGHPHYHEEMDPKGLFDFWQAISFAVTTVMVIVITVLFEFWPINKLAGAAGQPVRGVIGSVYILLVAFAIQKVFVHGFGMEQVEYLVRVPVSMIFGMFLINNMMQFSLFRHTPQPLRGLYLFACSVIAAFLLYYLYSCMSSLHAGRTLGMGGANDYERELWVASAMLGITFPVIFLVSGFFNFWPIKRD